MCLRSKFAEQKGMDISMIWIRADANETIGTGHIMRCISIARALEKCGQQVCFITADDSCAPILDSGGQKYRILHSDYRNMEDEIPELRKLFSENTPDFFLADSYFVTRRYLQEIRKIVPVGILDDMPQTYVQTNMQADLLINYNIFADASLYGVKETGAVRVDAAGTGVAGEDATGAGAVRVNETEAGAACGGYLLGTDYVPLRREFEGIDYTVREKAQTVLITTGGSDKYNIAGQLLKKALADPRAAVLQYLVVSGAYNVHLPELKELESVHENVHIFSNVRNMSGLMRASDIAVSAGGSTMYELSAVGVPVICFSFVDNQERIVRGYVEKNLTCFGGDYLRQGEAMLDEVVSNINRLAADFELRRSFSGKLRKVVDGRGAMRVAKKLCAEWNHGE